MQYVSSLGGPFIMLPTSDVDRWVRELGEYPTPQSGPYGLACSIENYCGVIAPWETPILVFGDDPADLYFTASHFDGLFFRWIGADSLPQLLDFAVQQAQAETWDETAEFHVTQTDLTVIDAGAPTRDESTQIRLQLRAGAYTVQSRYAQSEDVMTIVHRLNHVG